MDAEILGDSIEDVIEEQCLPDDNEYGSLFDITKYTARDDRPLYHSFYDRNFNLGYFLNFNCQIFKHLPYNFNGMIGVAQRLHWKCDLFFRFECIVTGKIFQNDWCDLSLGGGIKQGKDERFNLIYSFGVEFNAVL